MKTYHLKEPEQASIWSTGSLSITGPNSNQDASSSTSNVDQPSEFPVFTKLSEDDALKWLTLLQCPKLGIGTITKLSQQLPSLLSLFNDDVELKLADSTEPKKVSSKSLLTPEQLNTLKRYQQIAAKQYSYLIKNKISIITIESEFYPQQLKQSARPPIVLFARGNLALLHSPQIAFVGSRTPTAYGSQVTRHLVSELVHNGITVTSGLALGIDAIAHQSAINTTLDSGVSTEQGFGSTIAVMGGGHQYIYPKRHERLANEILDKEGLLLSEFLPDEKPQKFNFPRRNRIIAGLSLGTVVVEAALKSGSLITAQHAIEEGRDVFAVPGNIFNAVSAGCHELIKQGAKLTTSTADILEEYLGVIKNPNQSVKKVLAESDLLANVDYDTTPVDVISLRSNLPMEKVLVELLDLEIQGLIAAVPGGYCRVATNSNNK